MCQETHATTQLRQKREREPWDTNTQKMKQGINDFIELERQCENLVHTSSMILH